MLVGDRSMTTSDIYPGEPLLQALEHLAGQPGWCRDIFMRDDLFVAVRRGYLNVYHQGASIFWIGMSGGTLVAKTHVKYLVRAKGFYASIRSDGEFEQSPDGALWDRYAGPETLDEIIRASRRFAGPEKSGLHPLVVSNPDVVDLEVALTRKAEAESAEADAAADSASRVSKTDRIDAAVLAKRDGKFWIVFNEVKHFDNGALRAKNGDPAVLKQIDAYRSAIEQHRAALEERYRQVCAARVRIDDLRQSVRAEAGMPARENGSCLDMRDAAVDGVHIDPEPRLVIFGFDQAQKKDKGWSDHHEKLEAHLGDKVRTIGKPSAKSRVLRDPGKKQAAV